MAPLLHEKSLDEIFREKELELKKVKDNSEVANL
jgi:hypothetical protein